MLDNANSFRENIFNKQVNFEFNVINYECFEWKIQNKKDGGCIRCVDGTIELHAAMFNKSIAEDILFQMLKTKYFTENISDRDEIKNQVVSIFHW